MLDGEPIPPPKPIAWYPGLLAWRFEVSRAQLRGKGKPLGARPAHAAAAGSGAAAEEAAEAGEAAAEAAVPAPEESAEDVAAREAAAAVEASTLATSY